MKQKIYIYIYRESIGTLPNTGFCLVKVGSCHAMTAREWCQIEGRVRVTIRKKIIDAHQDKGLWSMLLHATVLRMSIHGGPSHHTSIRISHPG